MDKHEKRKLFIKNNKPKKGRPKKKEAVKEENTE